LTIIWEGERIFGGTEREDDWVFYHDALSTMTAKKTVEWMKTEFVKGNSGPTYHDKWMKPVLNITPDSRHYVGNQPEKMPMDNSCNEDQNLAVDRHVILSQVLSNDPDDPLTFSLATPRLGVSAYIRITHPDTGVSPTSDRIIEDCEHVWTLCCPILEHQGVFVPGLADWWGHRKTKKGNTGRNQYGGEREKMDMRDFIKVDDNGSFT